MKGRIGAHDALRGDLRGPPQMTLPLGAFWWGLAKEAVIARVFAWIGDYQRCDTGLDVVNGVFEEVAGVVDAEDAAASSGVIFQPATGVDADAMVKVQATLRRCILRAFVGRGLIDRLATLLPPPHIQRHRYFGVLEPNSPLLSG